MVAITIVTLIAITNSISEKPLCEFCFLFMTSRPVYGPPMYGPKENAERCTLIFTVCSAQGSLLSKGVTSIVIVFSDDVVLAIVVFTV
jgi:hypothetical protein